MQGSEVSIGELLQCDVMVFGFAMLGSALAGVGIARDYRYRGRNDAT